MHFVDEILCELETADNLKRFLILTVDGGNLELNPLALSPEQFVDENDLT